MSAIVADSLSPPCLLPQNNRGFAFIEFANEMATAAAMALTGTSVALDPAHPENIVRITVVRLTTSYPLYCELLSTSCASATTRTYRSADKILLLQKFAHERAPKPKPPPAERPPMPAMEHQGSHGEASHGGQHGTWAGRQGPRGPRGLPREPPPAPVIGAAYMPPERSHWGRDRSPSPPPKPRYS